MWKKFKMYLIQKNSFGQKRLCVLRNFVPGGLFLQSRGGSLFLYLEERTVNIKIEPIVKKIGLQIFVKNRTSIIHSSLKERTTHSLAFSCILIIPKKERMLDVLFKKIENASMFCFKKREFCC